MNVASLVPVIVGVGDVKNKSLQVEDAVEPMQLMLQAISHALEDTGLTRCKGEELRSRIDGIDVVASWTWSYDDLPGLLSQKMGITPKHKHYSKHGGNQPMKLVDEAARRIAQGLCSVAVVTGGEALASFHVYPLYENAFRAHHCQSIEENNMESAELYAQFAKIAEQNPAAWSYGQPAKTRDVITTINAKNRMICFPYPLLMNAFNSVNLAAACLMTSAQYARELGIPESKWVYPLGGAGTQDADNFWERPNFYSSPSISRSLDAALKASALTKEDIDVFDFYSCFPIVPKLACHHLKLPLNGNPKPITLLGGLTSFGGAGNNYSLHALTAMVRRMREGVYRNGLILANGGVLSYQHVVCLSTKPRRGKPTYPATNPLPEYVSDVHVPEFVTEAEGEAIIETYTVEFDRQGVAVKGFIVARMANHQEKRCVAYAGNAKALEQLTSPHKDPIGKIGWVKADGHGRNVFVFEHVVSL